MWYWSNGEWTAHTSISFIPDAPLWIGSDGAVVATQPAHRLARYSNGSWEIHDAELSDLVDLLGGEDASTADGALIWPNFIMQCFFGGGIDDEGVLWLTGSARARASFDGTTWTVGGDPTEDWGGWCTAELGPPALGPDGAARYAAAGGLTRWEGEARTVWNITGTWTGTGVIRSLGYSWPVAVAPDGRVWIPTRGTLVVFDPATEQWGRVPSDAGLPRVNESASIAADAHGSIWLAGPMGIARYTPPADGQFPADVVDTIDSASLEWEVTPLPTDRVATGPV